MPEAMLGVFLLFTSFGRAEEGPGFFAKMQRDLEPSKIVPYKTIGSRELKLHVFHPEGFQAEDQRPAHVVIHGGGWRSGTPRRFYPYANSLVPKGYVGISVEYRLVAPGKEISVFDCVKDGRSAIRFIRANAASLGVDPDRIAVSGGSAGGHVALGTALFHDQDHRDEDLKISCKPNALVLLFSVLDTSKAGYGNGMIGSKWKEISPLHQLGPKMPPTLLFHGDKDGVASLPILNRFVEGVKTHGNVCELVLEKGGVHGHINADSKLFHDAVKRTAVFLSQHMSGKEKD